MHVFSSLIPNSQNWKQSVWPSTGEWVNQLCCVHMGENCTAIKKEQTTKTLNSMDKTQKHYVK